MHSDKLQLPTSYAAVHDQPESGAVATRFSLMSLLQEHVLNAPDVCNNCFALVREEREQTASTDPRNPTTVEKSPYTRVDDTTTLAFAPAETPSRSLGVFCECGVESAYHRIWIDDDRCLTMPRFKDALKTLLRTLEAKGVTLDQQTCAAVALQHYRDENDVNAAFEAAVKAGVQRAAASDPRSKAARLSD